MDAIHILLLSEALFAIGAVASLLLSRYHAAARVTAGLAGAVASAVGLVAAVQGLAGPTTLEVPRGVQAVQVRSAQEMATAVERHFPASELVIKSAAVADYRPRVVAVNKVKKRDGIVPSLDLEPTKDILEGLGKKKGSRILVGFAAETQDLLANAQKKLVKKNLDLIVANDVSLGDYGFGADMNKATLLLQGGESIDVPAMSKQDLAHRILDCIAGLRSRRENIPDEPA